MSSQNPRPPRRRIAGERRPTRTDEAVSEPGAEPEGRGVADPEPHEATTTTAGPPDPGSGPVLSPTSEPEAPVAEPRRIGGPGPSCPVVAAVGALALVLVVVVVLLGLLKWNYFDLRDQDAVDQASRTAPAAAERASTAILSYDYRTLDADEKAAERYLTPSFKKQYVKSMNLVRSNAPKLRAKVEAEVKASGVSHADADRVNVLVYVNQTTTSTANGGQPQVALNRAMFSMARRGDAWLVDDITSY